MVLVVQARPNQAPRSRNCPEAAPNTRDNGQMENSVVTAAMALVAYVGSTQKLHGHEIAPRQLLRPWIWTNGKPSNYWGSIGHAS
jgi:hypothetical protein